MGTYTRSKAIMIRKGVLLFLIAIQLTSGKFLLIRLGGRHQINNFHGIHYSSKYESGSSSSSSSSCSSSSSSSSSSSEEHGTHYNLDWKQLNRHDSQNADYDYDMKRHLERYHNNQNPTIDGVPIDINNIIGRKRNKITGRKRKEKN